MMDNDLQAKARLERLSNWAHKEIHDVLMYKLNDSISADEVMQSERMAKSIVLGWFQRITNELISQELGPKASDMYFEHSYYQIAAGHLGTEKFADEMVPLKIEKMRKKDRAFKFSG